MNKFEEEKKPKQNFFAKIYTKLEDSYFNFSNWLTQKGINLNSLNNYLEKKGVPAFALFGSLLLIILFIIIYLLFFNINSTDIEFNLKDASSRSLSNVSVTIQTMDGENIFSKNIDDGDLLEIKKVKPDKEYKFIAKKSGYKQLESTKEIVSQEQTIFLTLDEDYDTGHLTIIPVDRDDGKIIKDSYLEYEYFINGTTTNKSVSASENGEIVVELPVSKNIDFTISADHYESENLKNFKLNDSEQTKKIELSVNTLSFSGESSKVTFVVEDDKQNPIDDALVEVYKVDGTFINSKETINGKALFDVPTGEVIDFVVSKPDYRTYESTDFNYSTKVLEDKSFSLTLNKGGSNLLVNVKEKSTKFPVSDVKINIYNENNSLIDSNFSTSDGSYKFSGLKVDSKLKISLVKENYFSETEIVSLKDTQEIDFELEKINTSNSSVLYVFVVDSKNNPVDNAKVRIYRDINSVYLPYGEPNYEVDVTGAFSIPLKVDQDYRVEGIVGDEYKFEDINIKEYQENKIIFKIDNLINDYSLELLDENGNPITKGHLQITSKDKTLLFDEDLNGESEIVFSNQGYNDLFLSYKDENSGLEYETPLNLDAEDRDMKINISKETVGDYPILEFVEVQNINGKETNFATVGEYYYLVFDLIVPKNTKNAKVHVRAGPDNINDSDSLSYGITGYSANTTDFKYSTTYNPTPAPGVESVDKLNNGRANSINKWLNLNFNDSKSISNQTIKVKIKATDEDIKKMEYKYRAEIRKNNEVYRNPKDEELNKKHSTDKKQSLYALTKSVSVNLFETPANCNQEFCVSYKFVDENGFEDKKNDFFAIKDEMYALEMSFFSYKNNNINIDAQTSKNNALVSFVSFKEDLLFPSNINKDTSSILDLKEEDISLEAGENKKVYLFFFTKDIGVTYLDLDIKGLNYVNENQRFDFEIFNKKRMNAVLDPPHVVNYGKDLDLSLTDSINGEPIENATIKVYDQYDQFVKSIKGSELNGVNGKYTIDQDFFASKIKLKIFAKGYLPERKEILVADDSILKGPNEVVINMGSENTTESSAFLLENISDNDLSDIKIGEPIFSDNIENLSIDIRPPLSIPKKDTKKFEVIVSTDSEFDYTTAKIPIYGNIGSRQTSYILNVRIIKSKINNNCLEIKPQEIDTYVGVKEGSTNTLNLKIKNQCDKQIVLNPEINEVSSSSNNPLELNFGQATLNVGEELNYSFTIKNPVERKRNFNYEYDIIWHNQYFSLKPTKLNIDVINLSESLLVTPNILSVPLAQQNKEQPAIANQKFFIENTGNVPIKDIQISRDAEINYTNMGVTEFPREIDMIKPGEKKAIDLKYEVKVNTATLDDMVYNVYGVPAGLNNRVEHKITVVFSISQPECIQINRDKLFYNVEIGERKTNSVTFVNKCAEAVNISREIDKRNNLYNQTFGPNNLSLYPTSYAGAIPVNGSATYNLDLFVSNYGGSTSMPVRFIGTTANSQKTVSSESVLVSVEIEDKYSQERKDKEMTENYSIPVCNNEDDEISLNFPKVNSGKCMPNSGYCDAYSAANLILEKVNNLYEDVLQTSSQYNNKTENSSCPMENAQRGFCSIDSLGKLRPIEFSMYLQNDNISKDLIYKLLSESDYEFKNYYVDVNPLNKVPDVPQGILTTANKLHLSSEFSGCGRYDVEINGFISANVNDLLPKRAYYYITINDYKKTDACKGEIQNFKNFLPWDKEIKESENPYTYLTVFTGDQQLGEKVSEKLFKKDDNRYVSSKASSSNNNKLNIKKGDIKEDRSALAKVEYNKDSIFDRSPVTTDLIVNEKYQNPDEQGLPKSMAEQTVSIVSSFLNNNEFSEVCISKDQDYLLIKDVIDAGDLTLKPENASVNINSEGACQKFTINSSVSENVSVVYDKIEGVDVYFKYKDKEITSEELSPVILKAEEDTNFFVCVKPTTTDLFNIIDEDIDVKVKSIYKETGNLGQREAESTITLSSCGITPYELLDRSYEKVKLISDKKIENNQEFYALIDWEKNYLAKDTQALCSALTSYSEDNEDVTKFFDFRKACSGIKESKTEVREKREEALKKSGGFMGGCMVACGGCSVAANLILNVIPFVGQFATLQGVLWDCGLPCLLGSLGVYVDYTSNNDVAEVLDKSLGKINSLLGGSEDVKVFRKFKSTAQGILSKIGIGSSTATATNRIVKNRPISFTKESSAVITGADVSSSSPTPTPTPTPDPNLTAAKKSSINNKIRNTYSKYFDDFINDSHNTGTPNKPATKYTPPKGVSKADISDFVTRTNLSDATFDIDNLLKDDVLKLKKYVGSGSYARLKAGFPPAPSSLATELDDFHSIKFTGGTPTPSSTTTTTTGTKSISKADYDEILDTAKTNQTKLADDIKVVDDELEKLNSKKRKGVFTKKKIGNLEDKKKVLTNAKSEVDDYVTKLSNSKVQGSRVILSDDAAAKVTDAKNGKVAKSPKIKGRASKFANFGFGLAKGLGCSILGISTGATVANNVLIDDILENSVVILNDIEFKKEHMYVVEINENNENKFDISFNLYNNEFSTSENRLDDCKISGLQEKSQTENKQSKETEDDFDPNSDNESINDNESDSDNELEDEQYDFEIDSKETNYSCVNDYVNDNCNLLDQGGCNGIDLPNTNLCARYATEVAKNCYSRNYQKADAWDMPNYPSNYAYEVRNRSVNEIKNYLAPGDLIALHNSQSNYLQEANQAGTNVTHMVVYIGDGKIATTSYNGEVATTTDLESYASSSSRYDIRYVLFDNQDRYNKFETNLGNIS